MARTLSINTTNMMGSPLEFVEFEELPKYEGTSAFPRSFDLATERPVEFPLYEEPPEFCEIDEPTAIMEINTSPRSPLSSSNKPLEDLARSPPRKPSPQPAHFSVPKHGNGNGHRILRSATVGYIAPEFKGKAQQMLQGGSFPICFKCCSDTSQLGAS
jgi:glutamate dehydrogenase